MFATFLTTPSIVYQRFGNLTFIKGFAGKRSTIIILNNTSSPYMPGIRNAADSIIEGRPWTYPEKVSNNHVLHN